MIREEWVCAHCDNDIPLFSTLDEAMRELKKTPGGKIRYVVAQTDHGFWYQQERRRAREFFKALAEVYGAICLCCGSERHLLVDHIIPLRRNGTSDIENLQLLCRTCNFRKGLRLIDYRPHTYRQKTFDEEVVIPCVA